MIDLTEAKQKSETFLALPDDDPGGSEWPALDPDNYPAYDKWSRGVYLSAMPYVRFEFTRYEQ